MPVENIDVSRIFDEVADLLEISGASFFRVRAYRNASRVIRDLSTPLYRIDSDPNEKLEDLPGVGKDLASRIREILETGDLSLRRELADDLPVGLLQVLKIPGIGPRKAHSLFLELGVGDIKSLKEAAQNQQVRQVKGFGPRTERKILEGIFMLEGYGDRMLRSEAEVYAESILEHMSRLPNINRVVVAGSYRRLVETVGDLDVLVTCDEPAEAMDHFKGFPQMERLIAGGPTKTSLVLKSGLQVDMRVVPDDSFGAALQYFTGSQAHSVALRGMAVRKGLKLNEYGVFKDGRKIAGKTEEEVYASLGLPWIPPELRENRGEIRMALEGLLPDLLEPADIRGDLHMHTDATDGRDTLESMARAARRKGYLYIAVTNHTRRLVGGLDGRALLRHWEEVDRLDRSIDRFHILKGVEVDILEDGSLDMPDEVLSRAEYVVASVHFDTDMTRSQMTRRIVKAIGNPYVNALGHPTARKINARAPYPVNMQDVITAAGRSGTSLELNSAPDRLDIDDTTCRSARDHGVKVSIATDAHSVAGLDFMRYGVNQARRGWLEKGDVVNTRTYRSLGKLLREARR